MLKRAFKLSAVVVAVVVFSSCEHKPKNIIAPDNNGTNDTTGTNTGKCDPDSVYFVNEILPIINSNCAQSGCHDAGTAEKGLILTDYANIMATSEIEPGKPSSGDFFEEINKGKMPPSGKLSQDLIDKINKWILQGAKNNSCNSGCDSTKYTYSADISKIINTNCVACHSSGNVLLNSHLGLQAVALNGRLLGALKHQNGYLPMPNASTFISDCDMKKIEKWIENNAPND